MPEPQPSPSFRPLGPPVERAREYTPTPLEVQLARASEARRRLRRAAPTDAPVRR